MRVAVEALGRGYVAAGARRLLVVPGATDAVHETEHGEVVEVRAPRVGSAGYRLIVEPWRVTEALERFAPTALELSDKTTLLPVALWARRRAVTTTLLSHERMDDMLAMRTGHDSASRVSIGLLNRLAVRSVDRVVVTSRYAAAELDRVPAGAGREVVRVPLGVDLATFRPGPWRTSSTLRLVLVSRLSREKSPHLAVATAIALHRRGVPVRLDVHGDGPHRSELEDLAGDCTPPRRCVRPPDPGPRASTRRTPGRPGDRRTTTTWPPGERLPGSRAADAQPAPRTV
ncbi:glycosyltransferase [Nocardioides litoris]|uniref:glycosyltransferase n=1 Tax=Nocardioides litoris TaxID=1926648 RepID=UPI001FEB32BE|nr:glycosyltransferase [Nocardioides litoris]